MLKIAYDKQHYTTVFILLIQLKWNECGKLSHCCDCICFMRFIILHNIAYDKQQCTNVFIYKIAAAKLVGNLCKYAAT